MSDEGREGMEGREMDERKERDRITIMKEWRGAEKEGRVVMGERKEERRKR